MERLTRDGVALAFEDVGKGAPPIVLIHDLGCDHTALQVQLEHFRGRHRVVAVDLLGHGQSDRLAQAYTVTGFADDLAWLCYELGVYCPVAVGHGVGGMIAVELAGRCPELLAAVVTLDAPIVPRPQAHAGIHEIIGQRHTAAHQEAVRPVEVRIVWPANDSQHEQVVAAIHTTPQLTATWENAMIWDGVAGLARCNVPVLYVESKRSCVDVERLRTVCPRVVVESIGLDPLDERPAAEQVSALINAFLLGALAGSVRSDGKEDVREGSSQDIAWT